MSKMHDPDVKVMKELVNELAEFNSYMRESRAGTGKGHMNGTHYYTFNPTVRTENSKYKKDMKLLGTTYRILDENHINIKSAGYMQIKDAVCIVSDMKSMNICFDKEIYPFIADKYHLNSKKGPKSIEHSIRNAIDAAYLLTKRKYPEEDCLMNSFEKKPTNKKFILRLAQEVSRRIIEETCQD